MACKCCCDGCHRPMHRAIFEDGQATGTGSISRAQRFCCECVPLHLCLTIGDESHYVGIKCVVQIADEDPTLYSKAVTINGSAATVRVRLRVNDADVCFVYVDISQDDTISDEREIDNSGYEADCGFCHHWMHTFTLDTSEFGDGTDTETLVHVAPADTITLDDDIGCSVCRCICRQACITRVGFSGGTKTVYDGTFDEVAKTVTWGPVVLRGNLPSTVNDFDLTTGTETSGTSAEIDTLDGTSHVIEGASGVDFYYELETNDAVQLLKVKWWGYCNGNTGESVTLQAWHWDDSTWETIGSIQVYDGTDILGRVFTLDDVHRGGTGDSLCRIRFVSSYDVTIGTDCMRTVSSNCCKLYLTGEAPEDEPPGGLQPVLIDGDNPCPHPEAQWNLSDADATVVFFECVKCNGCGSVLTACCPAPVSKVLTCEVTTNCTGSCATASFPLIDSTGGGLWSGGGSPCNIDLQLACTGSTWILTGSLGACTIVTELTQDITCEPFLAEFTIEFSGGLACCGGGADPSPITATVTISE